MKTKTLKTVISFYTTADAMETEAVFKSAGIKGRFIPVPRVMSAGCGIAWAMSIEDYKNIPNDVKRDLPEAEQIKEILI
jgi:hypothetical protein